MWISIFLTKDTNKKGMDIKMKLLMVDDEEYVMESIRKSVDLEKCGGDEICSAIWFRSILLSAIS